MLTEKESEVLLAKSQKFHAKNAVRQQRRAVLFCAGKNCGSIILVYSSSGESIEAHVSLYGWVFPNDRHTQGQLVWSKEDQGVRYVGPPVPICNAVAKSSGHGFCKQSDVLGKCWAQLFKKDFLDGYEMCGVGVQYHDDKLGAIGIQVYWV